MQLNLRIEDGRPVVVDATTDEAVEDVVRVGLAWEEGEPMQVTASWVVPAPAIATGPLGREAFVGGGPSPRGDDDREPPRRPL